MKNGIFVEGVANVQRFYTGVRTLEARGAREACWLLVEGDPGYGKTRALERLAAAKNAPFVRAKSDWTPRWALRDIADELGIAAPYHTDALYKAVVGELMNPQRQYSGLIVDEIDHAAKSARVLETLRDITDIAEIPLIAGGMKGARGLMKRYPQIYSRIAEIVTFGPASVADVKTICAALAEVEIADDLAAEIQRRTGGRLRDVKNAIARVEASMRRHRGPITLEDYGKRPLINEDRRPQLPVTEDV